MIRNIYILTLLLSMAYGECVITGCLSQICAKEPRSSDCAYLDWYACFQYSECGNYGLEGNCSWLTTDSFLDCLDSFGVTVGCTDPEACNYDETATADDGSCEYEFDCAGICGGNTIVDCDGVCGGDNFDCDGESLSLFNGLIPEEFNIHSIYPNPFNPVTNIIYGLPEHVNVQILVYDLSGKQVETLINEFQTPGYHSINWNASSYPSGVYLIRMESGEFIQTQKVVLVK